MAVENMAVTWPLLHNEMIWSLNRNSKWSRIVLGEWVVKSSNRIAVHKFMGK